MRRPAWNGSPPRDDAQARKRILDAAMRCIERHGAGRATLSDAAAELGVTRQTVYRHFSSTEDLFAAVGYVATDEFVGGLIGHVSGTTDPTEMIIESMAYTIERLPHDRYLALLLTIGHPIEFRRIAMSDGAFAASHAALMRSDVDWAARGYTSDIMRGLIEFSLRLLLSFIAEPDQRAHNPEELRRFLRQWVGPAISTAPQSCGRR